MTQYHPLNLGSLYKVALSQRVPLLVEYFLQQCQLC